MKRGKLSIVVLIAILSALTISMFLVNATEYNMEEAEGDIGTTELSCPVFGPISVPPEPVEMQGGGATLKQACDDALARAENACNAAVQHHRNKCPSPQCIFDGECISTISNIIRVRPGSLYTQQPYNLQVGDYYCQAESSAKVECRSA